MVAPETLNCNARTTTLFAPLARSTRCMRRRKKEAAIDGFWTTCSVKVSFMGERKITFFFFDGKTLLSFFYFKTSLEKEPQAMQEQEEEDPRFITFNKRRRKSLLKTSSCKNSFDRRHQEKLRELITGQEF